MIISSSPAVVLGRTARRIGVGKVQGMSMIEVLVSVLVLGVGLLGVAALQAVALRGGQGSLESSQAVMQNTSIIEAMRGNRGNAASYNMAMTCAAPAAGTLAQNDLRDWVLALKNTIGRSDDLSTCGRITNCPDACEVTVRWDDSRAGGSAVREVTTRTRI